MKKIFKSRIFLVILTVIITTSIIGVSASILYQASEIGFTPRNSNWKVDNLESALNDLYDNKGGSSSVNIEVPKLSSHTDPTAFSSGVHQNYYAYRAFDGNISNGGVESGKNDSPWAIAAKSNIYVGYSFGVPVQVNKAVYTPRYDNGDQGQNLKQYKYQYSDDFSTWVDATDVITTSSNEPGVIETEINAGKHRFWRIYVISNWGNNYTSVNELQFYAEI